MFFLLAVTMIAGEITLTWKSQRSGGQLNDLTARVCFAEEFFLSGFILAIKSALSFPCCSRRLFSL